MILVWTELSNELKWRNVEHAPAIHRVSHRPTLQNIETET